MIFLLAYVAWSLPFDLPDLTWWWWVIIAFVGGLFAAAVGKFSDQSRFAGFLSVVIAVLATLCGVVAIYQLLTG